MDKKRQIIANKTQIIKDYKDCKEKKNYCYDFDNIDSIKRLYYFLNIKNKKDIIIKNLHKKYPILIDIIQLEIDIGNITNDDIKLDGLKKEFKLLQKDIKITINNILNLKDDYNDYLESKLIKGKKTSEIFNILGYTGRDELIHRDNFIVT